ncbi:MAG: DUF2079 domain-containing protein [Euryarchaeota archaeon]|nr:DUF2079 domain-containing protein [Euryarchaeota archaeon]
MRPVRGRMVWELAVRIGRHPSWDPRGERGARRWLVVGVLLYFVVAATLSQLRLWELHAQAWDLGLYQQALWSGSHGGTLYEAGDATTLSAPSLLLVHTGFVLYLLVPFYALWPSPTLLFLVQALVVALAAVPLFGVTRELTGLPAYGLLAAALYLSWTPVLSSNLYDFHLEAFVPLELFLFLWLWRRAKYLPAAVVAALGALTLEVVPVFTALLAIFFLLPPLHPVFDRLREALRRSDRTMGREYRRALLAHLRAYLRDRRAVMSLVLLLGSFVGYYGPRALQEYGIGPHLGVAPPSVGTFLLGTPDGRPLLLANALPTLSTRLEFWVLLYALTGGIGLLAPRTLVLSLPWMTYTVLWPYPSMTTLGYQYGFLDAVPLMIGFAFGLVRVQALSRPRAPRGDPGSDNSGTWGEAPKGLAPSLGAVRATGTSPLLRIPGAAWIALLVLNLALSPLNPLLQDQGPAAGYQVSYQLSGGFSQVQALADRIPSGASVVATQDLFPFVANGLGSYPLSPSKGDQVLPFNLTDLPSYVLVSQGEAATVPDFLSLGLYSRSEFGLEGIVWSTTQGSVLLFARAFHGTTQFAGVPPQGPQVYGAENLAIGTSGQVVSTQGAPTPTAIESLPGSTGTVWYGPYVSLPPGNYTARLWLDAWSWGGGVARGSPALYLDASGFATPLLLSDNLNLSSLSSLGSSSYVEVDEHFTLPEAVTNFELRGYALDPRIGVALSSIILVPA